MGRDYSEGKFSLMMLPKRPCLDERRPMDVTASSGGNGASGVIGAGGGGKSKDDDVLFYVGKHRQPYNVSAESLTRGSAYFRNLLQAVGGATDVQMPLLRPIVMDCEESIFESLLLLIRYGAWEALPHMSEAEAFRLKREAQIYGVQYMEPPLKTPATVGLARANSADSSILSSTLSPASSGGGSPKSDTDTMLQRPANRRLSGRFHEGVALVGTTSSRNLGDLPDFPLDLLDPAKLLLVTCMDEEKAPIYMCSYCSGGGTRSAPTQWALSFHYKYAFCTSCGQTPAHLPPKHFAEMFTAAATHYQSAPSEQVPTKQQGAWKVGCDSTCLLRFVSSDYSGPDACRSGECAISKCDQADSSMWAASFLYSHAFCTRCGQAAHSPALVSLLLAIRYGGISNKKCARRQLSLTPARA